MAPWLVNLTVGFGDGTYHAVTLQGATPTVLLTGPGLDERFTMTTGTTTSTFLTDLLYSTLGLVNAAGALTAPSSYSPTGAGALNTATPFQYTGQENDGTGLYYYRARYYNPVWGRFISSDPIGFGGGMNTYAYVGGDPVNGIDPSGLFGWADMGLPQPVINVGEGVGDGIIEALTLDRYTLQDIQRSVNLPHGGADLCSAGYQVGEGVGFGIGLTASVGSGVTRFIEAAGTRSLAQSTMLTFHLLTGGAEIASSFTEISTLESQLASIAEMADEESVGRRLMLPGRPPTSFRLPPPQ